MEEARDTLRFNFKLSAGLEVAYKFDGVTVKTFHALALRGIKRRKTLGICVIHACMGVYYERVDNNIKV